MKLRSIVGAAGFLAAFVVAFAFTPAKKPVKEITDRSAAPLVWVKFDCNDPNVVETFEEGNYRPQTQPTTLPNYDEDCGGDANVCAVLLDYGVETTVEDEDGNVFPTVDITEIDESRIIRCQ